MNGYNGIDHTNDDFNVFAVSLQTVLSNWLGPVWWSFASLRMLLAWFEVEDGRKALLSTSKTVSADYAFKAGVEEDKKVGCDGKSQTSSNDNGIDVLSVSLTKADPTSSTKYEMDRTIQQRRPFFEYLTFHTFFTASSTLTVMSACIWLRDDPALWTVLASKYVNVALWATFHHFMINVVLCTGIWCAIVR